MPTPDSKGKILQLAIERGLLDADQVHELREEVHSQHPLSPSLVENLSDFQRYERLEYVGEGGMAIVYKAFDSSLGRTVALKFLRQQDPHLTQRLLMEARAQARVQHNNICKVYEVGMSDQKVYIAMQYLSGRPLTDLVDEISLEQKCKIMKEVADALHAAHSVGLIHRDIKPSNILVEHTPDADWVPYVMDFGLSRDVQAAGLTATGVVVGTAAYMSPEQARGEIQRLDRRSDIYSLGATMYEVFSGKLPFEAPSTVEILVQLMMQDPVPLRERDPNIPADLNTIVMKCLEKEQPQRYESAKAVAEDLRRYLEGEPILARRSGFAYRLWKKAKRNKAIVTTVLLAVVLLAIASAVAIHSKWTARRQAVLATRFGQQVKEMEGIMRVANMMPLHDLRPQKAAVRNSIRWIQSRMEEVGPPGYGPGHYAMGRGYLILQEYDRSKDSLEKAWQSGYKQPEVAYALGLVYGALYENALEQLQQIRNRELRDLRRKSIEHTFREPALRYLSQARGLDLDVPEYVEGLISFYEKDYPAALAKSEAALKRVPWLYEAIKLQGDSLVSWGRERLEKGDFDLASQNFEEAGQKYHQALDLARGDAGIHEAECERWIQKMRLADMEGKTSENALQEMTSACDKSLEGDPDNAAVYEKKSYAFLTWANFQSTDYGKDPRELLEQAIEMGKKALRLDPKRANAYNNIGTACWNRAQFEMLHGTDPHLWLQQGIENFRHALALEPQNPSPFVSMGIVYGIQASYEISSGQDPSQSLQNSIARFRESIERNPDFLGAYNDLCLASSMKVSYEIRRGGDPRKTLADIIATSEKAIRINPAYADAYSNLGEAFSSKGSYEIAQGLDPRASLLRAVENYKKALELKPNFAYAYDYLCRVYQAQAEYETLVGLDPTASLDAGLSYALKAIGKNPDFPEAHASIGILNRIRGEYLVEHRSNPEEALRESRKAFETAGRINPRVYWIHLERGRVEILAARWALLRNNSPAAFLDQSDKAFNQALQLNQREPDIYLTWAESDRRRAEWKLARKQDSSGELKRGMEKVDKVLAANPESAEGLATRGVLLLLAAKSAQPSERPALAQQSQSALQSAIRKDKNLDHRYAPYLDEAVSLCSL